MIISKINYQLSLLLLVLIGMFPNEILNQACGISNCVSCSNNNCVTCNPGFFRITNGTNFVCNQCDTSCNECVFISTNCTSCKEPLPVFKSNTGQCISEGTCNQTQGFYFIITTKKECKMCDSNCFTCLGTSFNCTACSASNPSNKNYFLNNSCISSNACTGLGPFYTDETQIDNAKCLACSAECAVCQGSSTNCSSCLNGFYLKGNQCFTQSQCDSITGFFANPSLPICSPCDSKCLTCQNSSTKCLSCKNQTPKLYFYALQNQCVTDVECLAKGPNFFNSNSLSICDKCNTKCLTCSGSATTCLQCANTFFHYSVNNSCLTESECDIISVPSDFYGNAAQKKCLQCLSQCKTCTQAENKCTSCVPNASPQLFLFSNQCIQDCSVFGAFFGSIQSFACESCFSSCKSCSGKEFNQCLSCDSLNDNYFFNNECIKSATCNSKVGFFSFSNTQTNLGFCNACSGNCKNCIGFSTNCTSCKVEQDQYLSGSVCVTNCGSLKKDKLSGKCVQNCPFGTYLNISFNICELCPQNLNCKTCIQGTNCISCDANLTNVQITPRFLDSTGTCSAQCPQSFFGFVDSITFEGTCISCQPTCFTCDQSANTCTSCKENQGVKRYLFVSNSSCILNCPNRFFNQYFNETQLGICIACHQFCELCTGPTENDCTSCRQDIQNLFYYNYQCFSNCPDFMFNQVSDKTCQFCESPCAFCQNTALNCTSCIDNKFYFNFTCRDDCNGLDGYFTDASTMACSKCDSKCKLCSNLLTCDQCDGTNFFMDESLPSNTIRCVQQCSNGLYASREFSKCVSSSNCGKGRYGNDESKMCQLCLQQNCQTCNGDGSCQICSSQYQLVNKECVLRCPKIPGQLGRRWDEASQSCLDCSVQNCEKCQSDFDCIECFQGLFVYQDLLTTQCVSNCSLAMPGYKEIDGICFKQPDLSQGIPDKVFNITFTTNGDQVNFKFHNNNPSVEFIFMGWLPSNSEGNFPLNHKCGSKTTPENGLLNGIEFTTDTSNTYISLTLSQLYSCGFWEQNENKDKEMLGFLQGYVIATYRDESFFSFMRHIKIDFTEKISPSLNITVREIVGILVNADEFFGGFLNITAISNKNPTFYNLFEQDQIGTLDKKLIGRRNSTFFIVIQLPDDLTSKYRIAIPVTCSFTNMLGAALELPIKLNESFTDYNQNKFVVEIFLDMNLQSGNIHISDYYISFDAILTVSGIGRRFLQENNGEKIKLNINRLIEISDDDKPNTKGFKLIYLILIILLGILMIGVGLIYLKIKMYPKKQSAFKQSNAKLENKISVFLNQQELHKYDE